MIPVRPELRMSLKNDAKNPTPINKAIINAIGYPIFPWPVKPIISEITIERDRQLFHLNEDQLNLKFYWYFGYPDSSQSETDHQKAYVTALRGIVDFENEDTINIDIEDAIGKALLNVHGTNYYKEHYVVTFTNGKYIWSLTSVEVPQNIDLVFTLFCKSILISG